MKKLQIELHQVGAEIITQSGVKIRVNGKFVKNDLVDIVLNCFDNNIRNIVIKVEFLDNRNIVIRVEFQNGNVKRFNLLVPKTFAMENYIFYINHKSINTKEFLYNDLKLIKKAIEEIEKYIIDNSTICNNYFFEV